MTKEELLKLIPGFETVCYLENNKQINAMNHHTYDSLFGIGKADEIKQDEDSFFNSLEQRLINYQDWWMGCLGYDLKNEIEELSSNNKDYTITPSAIFFCPKVVIAEINGQLIFLKGTEIELQKLYHTPENIYTSSNVHLKSRISKEEYFQKINAIKQHIIDGDIYELNFCMEFYAEDTIINPFQTFIDLNFSNPSPFAGFLKDDSIYIISSSPERFLKKQGKKLIAQPIKGTIKRNEQASIDEEYKQLLYHNEKERSENVMIVDLMRNDLAKSSTPGSVEVEEIFGIYTFSKVHQMISTVKSEIRSEINITQIIQNAFPMGSMTGCPKIRAMELIEEYEETKRGLYSGALGYITPELNFDFNVLIRTFIYNANKKYLSVHAGSAITYDSQIEMEYEECLLKTQSLREVLK